MKTSLPDLKASLSEITLRTKASLRLELTITLGIRLQSRGFIASGVDRSFFFFVDPLILFALKYLRHFEFSLRFREIDFMPVYDF